MQVHNGLEVWVPPLSNVILRVVCVQGLSRNPWQAQNLQLDARPFAADFAAAFGDRNQKVRLLEGLLLVCLCIFIKQHCHANSSQPIFFDRQPIEQCGLAPLCISYSAEVSRAGQHPDGTSALLKQGSETRTQPSLPDLSAIHLGCIMAGR